MHLEKWKRRACWCHRVVAMIFFFHPIFRADRFRVWGEMIALLCVWCMSLYSAQSQNVFPSRSYSWMMRLNEIRCLKFNFDAWKIGLRAYQIWMKSDNERWAYSVFLRLNWGWPSLLLTAMLSTDWRRFYFRLSQALLQNELYRVRHSNAVWHFYEWNHFVRFLLSHACNNWPGRLIRMCNAGRR